MKREFDSFVENKTIEWQKGPKNKNTIGNRWIFTIKSKRDRNHKYKVHFVAKGHSQIYRKRL